MQNTLRANRQAGVPHALAAWGSEGWRRLEQGDAQAACRAFQRLIEAALEHAAGEAGADGLRDTLQQAVSGLERCLAALEENPQARRDALQVLFQIYQADAGRNASGLAGQASFVMLRYAGREERLQLAAWLRRALAAARDAGLARHYWRLLLDLEALDPAALEAALAQCRAAGHAGLVAEKLLDLDRLGEALMTACQELRDTEELLHFAESPAAHGQARAVMALVEERLGKAFDPRLANWLATRYAERGDLPRALDLRLRLLQAVPGNGDYQAVQDLARRLGRWEQLQPQVARALQRSRRG